MKKSNIVLLTTFASLLLVGCGATSSNEEPTSSNPTTVEPTTEDPSTNPTSEETATIEINEGETLKIYETQSVFLTVTFSPSDAKVTWESSDTSVATIGKTGALTGIKEGTTTIKASLSDEVYDEIVVTVAPLAMDIENAPGFDYSGLYSENPSIKSSDEFGNDFNSYAAFKATASSCYIASATAKLTNPQTTDTWSRVGISHLRLSDKAYYGLQVSPGPNFTAQKTVTMVIDGGGNVQWGDITDRSQVWHGHLTDSLDWNNIKLTTIRVNSYFFTFVNDVLYYYDYSMSGFDDVDTVPCVNVGSAQAEFTNLQYSNSIQDVEAYLATADNRTLYAMDGAYTTVTRGQSGIDVKFTGASEQKCTLNAKDHAAKSIGAATAIFGAGICEFDLKINSFGSRDALPALAVTLNRYDSQFAEARSLIIGQYKAGWTGWNSNGNLNDGIGDGGKAYLEGDARLEEGETYHVVFERTMYDNGQDTKLTITNATGTELLSYEHGWHDGYKGAVVFSLLNRDLDCEVTDFITYEL